MNEIQDSTSLIGDDVDLLSLVELLEEQIEASGQEVDLSLVKTIAERIPNALEMLPPALTENLDNLSPVLLESILNDAQVEGAVLELVTTAFSSVDFSVTSFYFFVIDHRSWQSEKF